MAGHSKWANIKHRKGAQDAKRGRLNTRLIREVMVAARMGGSDKATNPSLRLAVERANKANVTKESIEKAILKATGQLPGVSVHEVSYEGYGPNGVALWVHCLTDNRNRTVAEVRHIFNKYGGTLGAEGSVGYLFERVAYITCLHDDVDEVLEVVLDFDVKSVEKIDENIVLIQAEPSDLNDLCQSLSQTDWTIEESKVTYLPTAMVSLDADQLESFNKMYLALDELDDVQDIYYNCDEL
ncbi:YebC/PmpR family DNA-binding transcriptional regulator [Candidatus Comchoanobacter bicostacola]|uniref:Probable transcriptional regulatory protein MMH89_04310 n=1 Tax=Candidatus Comchoanobacter bicostacola TaxID=2919598 RepID=A0ABY5DJF3_9GAMM|nr:YebC/PmpR family DNA-binding transcriptional regulator [Candidatus Comchoanobacter bicostacola]UTC24441.1 YebC/PmpR family DNA-binding transcriptional regulator [Candidatus Comchoanobacter bicostacola]